MRINSRGFYTRMPPLPRESLRVALEGWLDVFTRNEYKDLVLESLEFCQKNKGMEIHAWCIMTNHVHLIFRSIENQKPELLLGDFKRFTSRSVVKAIQENPKESRKEFLLDYFKKEAEKSSNTTNFQLFWVYQIRQYFNERKNKLSTSIL